MITIVTLDGPAGVGKTTIARELADRLGIAYLDTGAMFRSVALFFGDGGWERPVDQLVPELNRLDFDLEGTGKYSELLLNGLPLAPEIRKEEVGLWASHLARIPVVRDFLRRNQQAIGRSTSLVAEGRDMGSVVFPGARHKFFMDASIDVRAKRRHAQLKAMGMDEDLERIQGQIRIRDDQDRNRVVAPLKPALDAVIIDTSALDADRVLEKIVEHIREKGLLDD